MQFNVLFSHKDKKVYNWESDLPKTTELMTELLLVK